MELRSAFRHRKALSIQQSAVRRKNFTATGAKGAKEPEMNFFFLGGLRVLCGKWP
jgi:hypothetical protein